MENDKQQELLADAIGEGGSDCCGARVYAPSDEWALCMDCGEYCSVISDFELA